MDRAYKSGAVASPPAATDNTSVGYPTAGNPQTGEMPTKPGPYWFHMMTEELVNVLTAAGITPDKATTDQLLTALQSLFVNVSGDVMTGNLTLPELRVGDANARVRRDGNFAMFENDVSFAVISSLSPVHLTTNAKRQGADWNRIDTTLPAALCRVDGDGNLYSYYAAAGANPINWGSPRKIWAAGNDGAGSGLDADLLDGLQPAVSDNANTIAQRDGAGALAVANATAAGHAVALGQLNAPGSPPMYVCRAWVNFDGTTSPIAIRGSGNVSSITDNGAGDYTVNFASAMPDANYSCAVTPVAIGGTINVSGGPVAAADMLTTSVRVITEGSDGGGRDTAVVSVVIHR